jgi:C4-dicarboxylate-specific signal transduction histidine kinase
MVELYLNYFIVILALVLLIGVINAYYLLDFILQKENREKLYIVWLMTFSALIVHSSAHFLEETIGENIISLSLEAASLVLGFFGLLIIAKATMNYYSFLETKRRLEVAVAERTEELEASNLALKEKIADLEQWQRLTVGREVRMSELKSEIKSLKEEIIELKDRLS